MCDTNYIINNEVDRMAIEATKDVIDTSRAALNNGKINGGEVFTPNWCVVDMGNLVGEALSRIDATVMEPTCGSGNILIDVLRRKMATVMSMPANEFMENAMRACKSIYGVDISKANVLQSRERLMRIVLNAHGMYVGKKMIPAEKEQFMSILETNIIWGDMMSEQMWDTKNVASNEEGLALSPGRVLVFKDWKTGTFEKLNGQKVQAWELDDDDETVDDF